MSNQIPGVPEGWELVRIGHPVIGVDCVIDYNGDIVVFRGNPNVNSGANWPIIRKIEKPARYRPFKDAEEAHPFWNAPLRLAGATEEMKNSWSRITTIEKDGITTSAKFYTWEQAYYRFYIDDNHTPFGVKIDE
jgi:hypothetical protein